jgi:ABC-type iron transport system FetAB permease component
MHERLMKQRKKRVLTRENFGILVMALLALALATITDRRGMPHKWHAAILGTVIPFGVVVLSYPLRWSRWSFWVSLGICLIVHTLAIWIVFQHILSNIQNLGILLWLPIAFIEMFVLLVAVKRVEEKLTGKPERYTLA